MSSAARSQAHLVGCGPIEGRIEEAKRHASAAVELAEKLRERYELANAYMYSGWLYALEGAWQSEGVQRPRAAAATS